MNTDISPQVIQRFSDESASIFALFEAAGTKLSTADEPEHFINVIWRRAIIPRNPDDRLEYIAIMFRRAQFERLENGFQLHVRFAKVLVPHLLEEITRQRKSETVNLPAQQQGQTDALSVILVKEFHPFVEFRGVLELGKKRCGGKDRLAVFGPDTLWPIANLSISAETILHICKQLLLVVVIFFYDLMWIEVAKQRSQIVHIFTNRLEDYMFLHARIRSRSQ